MEPLYFNHIYFETIWGGERIASFRHDTSKKIIGQVWDVSCHDNGMSEVISPFFKGKSLQEIYYDKRADIIGTELIDEKFPLHISILDAKDNLSIQVHPNDTYAYAHQKESGKTEAWYIMDCQMGAFLYAGTNLVNTNELLTHLEKDEFNDTVNKVPVKKGDFIVIPSGLIHALGHGILAVEISQNADTTFRVYDYGRGRKLNVAESIDCIRSELHPILPIGVSVNTPGYIKTYKYAGKYFAVEILDIKSSYTENSDPTRFYILTCTEGNGKITYSSGETTLNYGDSVLIPASLGIYTISGKLTCLKSYKPDILKLHQEISKYVF